MAMFEISAFGSSGQDFASALGWSGGDMRHKIVCQSETTLDIARTYIAGESAALFATVTARNGVDPVECAALYGYHVAGEWGLVADPEKGVTLFNSRWIDGDRWYRWPTIPWTQVENFQNVFEAFSPAGLLKGGLTALAEQRKKPTSFLVPVDDALVNRLDSWRDEALRYSKLDANIDGYLQHIYAQLFVLRTVEDRGLDGSVPAIFNVITKQGELDWRKWTATMRVARKRIGSELFALDMAKQIPAHVLVGIVRDLYTPRKLPGDNARYNFSWMDADVLGVAYEKYLASVLQPGATSPQIDMFLSSERQVNRVSVRKGKGVYYTPKYITNYLATKTVDEYFSKTADGEPPYVVDFACGSGAFLVAAVDRVLHHLKDRDPDRAWAKELILSKHIAGIDIDPNAVELARLGMWQRLLEEPDALPLPSLSDVIALGDGLRRETWGGLDREYDIVLGNPPFLATGKVESREMLEARFVTAKGRYDFSSLFVEQAVRALHTGGRLGMVIPNRFFRNTNGSTLRGLLTREANLLTIVDFGTTRPFEANAYIGCIVAEKRLAGANPPSRVKVLEVSLLEADFIAELLLSADRGGLPNRAVRMFEARHPTGSMPWVLLSEQDQLARVHLEDSSARLDTLAIIAQGIRTGANDFFIFEIISDDGSRLCEVTNGLGERLILERDLLEPVIHGSEVRRYAQVHAQRRLLYPYRNGVPIPESELRAKYARTWDYLVSNREVLGARASLIQSNGKFFELVRPRDESWLRRPKLLIRDLAPRTSFALDEDGAIFLVGGTAVAPHDVDTLGGLLGYLNSSFVNEYVRQLTPSFQGDYQKFEPKHLQSIPVLRKVIEDRNFQNTLADLAWACVEATAAKVATQELERQIDELVSGAAREAGAK